MPGGSVLFDALSAARDLGRLHDIAMVLVRNGLGDAVRRLGMAGALERAGKVLHWKGAERLTDEPEVRFRRALEELGPTFVKIGQILAGRSDLLPPDWTEELARLHQHVEPLPFEDLREQLVEDLGGPPEEAFRDFETEPLAAASIAQVHRATLKDGTPVVLKIRRPEIREVVEADLRLLARFAETAEESMPELRRFRPKSLVRHFRRTLREELDLRVEAKHAERLRANTPEDCDVVIPRIHREWTRERLCVMDRLEGPSIGDWLESDASDPARGARIARLGAETVLRTVFVDGFFHADPHPGNVLVLENERIGLVDFGMIGVLSESRRTEFLDLLVAVVSREVEEMVELLAGWSDGKVDLELLSQDCVAYIDRYYGLSLGQLETTALLEDLTRLLRENDLFLPNDVAMLLKVFVTLDGLGRRLDPDFVMAEHVEPFAQEAWKRQRSPVALVGRSLKRLRLLMKNLPRDLRHLASWARRGRLHVEIEVENLERFGRTINASANRLTVGLVTAALIVGTSITLTVEGGPRVFGMPLFGFLGFGGSLIGGLWLLGSIVRSGRR